MIEKLTWTEFKKILANGVRYRSFANNRGDIISYAWDGGLIVCEITDQTELQDYVTNYQAGEATEPLNEKPLQKKTLNLSPAGSITVTPASPHSIPLEGQGRIDLLHIKSNRKAYSVALVHNGIDVAEWDVEYLSEGKGLDIDRVKSYPIFVRSPGFLSMMGPIHYLQGTSLEVRARSTIRIYGFMEYTI